MNINFGAIQHGINSSTQFGQTKRLPLFGQDTVHFSGQPEGEPDGAVDGGNNLGGSTDNREENSEPGPIH